MTNYKNGIYYEMIPGKFNSQNLVFIHGSGCNHKFLRSLALEFPDYNCYLPDLPDHGNSENRDCTTAEEYVDAMAEFVSDLKNVTLIGHSLGGTICLGVAAKSLPSVQNCVIISSGAKFDKLDPRIHNMVQNNRMDWPYVLKCLGSFHSLTVLRTLLTFEAPEICLKDFKIDCELNLDYTLKNIDIPTLIMVGQDDILTIPEYSYKMRKGIKDARLIRFPRCRHMLPLARKKDVANLVRRFVATSFI